MSYSISHHLCNCSLTSTIYWLPVGTHVSGTDPRFDPDEQLASALADFGRALARMKCPSNYLSGLTKYVPTSSILPIPVAINGYVLYGWCIKHVRALFISVLHTVWCSNITVSSSISPIPATNLQYMTQDITRDVAHLLFLVDANPVVLNMLVHVLMQGHNGRCCCFRRG